MLRPEDERHLDVWAVVVAQLLPIPEIGGSNPVIGNIIYYQVYKNCIEKMTIKKKRPGMAQFLRCRYDIGTGMFLDRYLTRM